MISYFISYTYTDHNGFGFGNFQLDRAQPILSQDDIIAITAELRKQVKGSVIVLSFTRFDTDAETETRTHTKAAAGPLDGLVLDYIRDLLSDAGHPLSLEAITGDLGFPKVAVRRVVDNAVRAGRLINVDGGYTLPAGA